MPKPYIGFYTKETPDDSSSLVGLAQIAVLEGSFEEGITLLRDAGRSESGKPLARYYLALLLMRLNRAREAIGYLKEANEFQAACQPYTKHWEWPM